MPMQDGCTGKKNTKFKVKKAISRLYVYMIMKKKCTCIKKGQEQLNHVLLFI